MYLPYMFWNPAKDFFLFYFIAFYKNGLPLNRLVLCLLKQCLSHYNMFNMCWMHVEFIDVCTVCMSTYEWCGASLFIYVSEKHLLQLKFFRIFD